MRRGTGTAPGAAILLGASILLGAAGCSNSGPGQRAAIEKAVRTYVASSGCCQFSAVSIERVTISRTDGAYATAFVDGFANPHSPAGSLTAVLGDAGGSGWVVLGLGTAPGTLGCNVPPTVASELGLACGVTA